MWDISLVICAWFHSILISAVYVNHRPAFGLSPSQLGQAFRLLGERVGGDQRWTMDRATLLSLIQEKGVFKGRNSTNSAQKQLFHEIWASTMCPCCHIICKLLLIYFRRASNRAWTCGVSNDPSQLLWESRDWWMFLWRHRDCSLHSTAREAIGSWSSWRTARAHHPINSLLTRLIVISNKRFYGLS